ncbi:sensor histidine kinase [Marinomonas ostreistagni]|uniref:sensor histidine kinase n=1 Tax=Marinomonas ostreistagni TaxID=359209 RepID=UPI001951A59B|nr:GAF domain-containing sensor histidine kinase [Marinomonas ostreistagni]MBM6552079.1 GAF domain-containing sensor histidine kinase [Marinomonas ostreistagni]
MNAVLESILLSVSQSQYIDEGDLERSARLILDSLVEGLNVDRAGLWLMSEDSESIECHVLIDVYNNIEEEQRVLTRREFPKYFQALDEARTIRANDAYYCTVIQEFLEPYIKPRGIGSRLDTPIRHRGKMIGVISSESTTRGRNWSDDEASFSGALCDLYGRALSAYQRAQFEAALCDANAKLELKVKERTKELNQALDELKSTQDHLVESEKMAALGGLVSGVAHEVNTPLGVAITSLSHIKGEVTTLRDDYAHGRLDENSFIRFLHEFDSAHDIAQSNMERAAKLVSDFKKTAVDQASNVMEEVNLSRSLDALVSSLKPIYKPKKVTVTCDVPQHLRLITYSGAIDQIITNLVNNSCIHGFESASYDNEISLVATQESDEIVLDYHDNGKGMTAEVAKRVFEPFFTTGRTKGGSGLGMSITYNLVTQKLKGEIKVLNDGHQGVHFQIRLPLQHPDAAMAQAQ